MAEEILDDTLLTPKGSFSSTNIRDNDARRGQLKTWSRIYLFVIGLELIIMIGGISTYYQNQDLDYYDLSTSNTWVYTLQSVLNFVSSIIGLVFLVMTILWTRRAYWNLHELKVPGLRWSEGWAAGAWFVPIISFFAPFQIMRDVWSKTQMLARGESRIKDNSLVNLWWTCHLAPMGLAIIAVITTLSSGAMEGNFSQSMVILQWALEAIGSLCVAASTLILLSIVKHFDDVEEEMLEVVRTTTVEAYKTVELNSEAEPSQP
jgi:hypothetical protein